MALFFEFYPSFCVQSFEKIQKYKNKGIISNNLEVSPQKLFFYRTAQNIIPGLFFDSRSVEK
jgi:hypothetical protein